MDSQISQEEQELEIPERGINFQSVWCTFNNKGKSTGQLNPIFFGTSQSCSSRIILVE